MNILILLFVSFTFRCCAGLDTEWWKHTIIYEIIPYTFKDSDGDGIGDIKGIISKLDHFVDLKIETLHFTPIHETTGQDVGYDVNDFRSINHQLGTMEDFHELIREMKKRNMKLLLDFIVNHSSNKHEWFLKSIDKIDPYTDYYVWKDPKGYDNETEQPSPIPPNNWYSVFGGSAWKWNEKRKQFYLHQFLEEQVDLNLWNQNVVEELKSIMKFWLDKGVTGFRLDAVNFCIEDKEYRDNDYVLRQRNQDETYAFLHELRLFLDEYNKIHGGFERIFVAEAHVGDDHLIKLYGKEDYPVTHFPYTFALEYIWGDVDAQYLKETTQDWLNILPKHSVSCWMIQDHDGWRVGSKIRPESSDILTTISMLLPGSVGVYYGQEIAMLNGYVYEDQIKDFSFKGRRDPGRLIMQWDDSFNAGFSTNTTSTYLPAATDYFSRNVELQKSQKNSHYHILKDLSTLRTTDTIKYGDTKIYVPTTYVYIFSRYYKNQVYYVVVNMSSIISPVNLNEVIEHFPQTVTITTASLNAGFEKGSKLEFQSTDELIMKPMSCVVLQGNIGDEQQWD